MDWQPIETLDRDGRLVLFYCPAGSIFIAPAAPLDEPTAAQKVSMYRQGVGWSNVKWNASHWMPLPAPPTAPERS